MPPDGVTLRRLRDARGLSQAQAAELAVVSLRAYRGYELGERRIPARKWQALAAAYERITPDAFGASLDRMRGEGSTGLSGRTGGASLAEVTDHPTVTTQSDELIIVRPAGISDDDWSKIVADTHGRALWLLGLMQQASDARAKALEAMGGTSTGSRLDSTAEQAPPAREA